MLEKVEEQIKSTSRATALMAERIDAAMLMFRRGDAVSVIEGSCLIREALEDVKKVEERCNLVALAVRQYALLQPGSPTRIHEEIWHSLKLDDDVMALE
ncbi:MAG TPA: hypothetical protein VL147_12605 [Devosia sp.]|nr:hypothetical protein [Devosia sp.]